ncbi:MAG: response regulator, partial [Acidimicrobiales bacterium]
RQVLEASDDIIVVGEADDGNAALAVIDDLNPDVVLIDVRLPDRNGIDVARQLTLTHPNVRVVILSAYDDDGFVRAALEAGATGYLLKTMARDDLVAAVRAASQGTTVLDPTLSPRLAAGQSAWGASAGCKS